MDGLTDHVRTNRAFWNELADTYQADHSPEGPPGAVADA